jgi:hypothetical protein
MIGVGVNSANFPEGNILAKPTVYEPRSGENFNRAVARVKQAAEDLEISTGGKEDTITLNFSSVAIPVKKDSDPKELWQFFEDAMAARRKEQAPREEEERRKKQAAMDTLLGVLYKAVEAGPDAVLKWMKEYIGCANHIGVKARSGDVAETLKDAGYAGDMGIAPDMTNEEAMELLGGSRSKVARFIVGQMVANMDEDHLPMPRFAFPLIAAYEAMSFPPEQPQDPASASSGPNIMKPLRLKQ